MQLIRVVFPDPLGPMMPKTSPFFDLEADVLQGLNASEGLRQV